MMVEPCEHIQGVFDNMATLKADIVRMGSGLEKGDVHQHIFVIHVVEIPEVSSTMFLTRS